MSRAQDTVRFILDATDKLRGEGGIEAVTMKRVAQVAGVGVGTLYHHFPDRAALLREVEQRAWAAELASLLSLVPPTDMANIDKVAPLVVQQAVASIIRRIDAVGVSIGDPDVRTAMFGLWDDAAKIMAQAVAPAASRFRHEDLVGSLRLAIETLSMMSWVAAERHRDRVASGDYQRELADMLMRYLLKEPRTD